VYTKLLFKRPVITEESELQKKLEESHRPLVPEQKPTVDFEQLMVNIAMTSGKAHYATIAWAVECRDDEVKRMVEEKKDLFVDRVISTLGKRQITELNTIQGKLLLKTELMGKFNELTKPAGITDIYFNTFILQ
ncbi:MAG TPA: flagellar basal body-associated FliL family protein, partial [Oligoflexia bacterium]|nr:flagellar basal body-associated FliL family protein [Oligoflexia bacterium]